MIHSHFENPIKPKKRLLGDDICCENCIHWECLEKYNHPNDGNCLLAKNYDNDTFDNKCRNIAKSQLMYAQGHSGGNLLTHRYFCCIEHEIKKRITDT